MLPVRFLPTSTSQMYSVSGESHDFGKILHRLLQLVGERKILEDSTCLKFGVYKTLLEDDPQRFV